MLHDTRPRPGDVSSPGRGLFGRLHHLLHHDPVFSHPRHLHEPSRRKQQRRRNSTPPIPTRTTTHVIGHTDAPSGFCRLPTATTFARCSLKHAGFGSTVHHPNGFPSRYAMTPGPGALACICSRSIPAHASEVELSNSRFAGLKDWHQHRAGSPRVPNARLTSSRSTDAAASTLIPFSDGMHSRYARAVAPLRCACAALRVARHPGSGAVPA